MRDTHEHNEPPAARGTASDEGFDLRALFHAAGSASMGRALNATLPERTATTAEVELIDTRSAPIACPPLEVGGFVDGIQSAVRVAHRDHRPVYLFYVAAGAVARWGEPVGVHERLCLVCSSVDRAWVDEVNVGLMVVELEETSPPEVERAAARLLSGTRDGLERTLVDELLSAGVTPLVVDGSLTGRPASRHLVGVVKTTRTRYLDDERPLYDLSPGWRSARFAICERDDVRYSCYLRMTGGSDAPWDFGLVRLEARDIDLLEPLGARALEEFQGYASGDGRYDRHLATVRACEDFLRARRPPVFSITT